MTEHAVAAGARERGERHPSDLADGERESRRLALDDLFDWAQARGLLAAGRRTAAEGPGRAS